MISYLSIIIGMICLVSLMYKKWSPLVVGLVCTSIIILMNGLKFGEIITEVYFVNFASVFQTLFPMIFVGSLLAQLYVKSGAVDVIANTLSRLLFKQESHDIKKYRSAILAIVISSGFISYCGINSAVVLIAMYPIALRIMEKANIPKKYVMGIITGGVYTFALTGPGSTELPNVIAMQIMGTASTAGFVAGFAAIAIEITMITVILSKMIKKSVEKGERFAYGPKDYLSEENKKLPNIWFTLIPLLVLVLSFNIFSLNIVTASILGYLTACMLLWKYAGGASSIIAGFPEGGTMAFIPTGSIASVLGFSAVIRSLPVFDTIMNSVFSLEVSPALILILSISFIALLTGSSSTAIRVALPVVSDTLLAKGISASFIHRVGCFASTIVDSMPYSGAVVMTMSIADLDMKDGYPSIFVSTTVATLCGTIVCALIMYLFPWLP